MARRIEIELTSARPDGTWTWRAAGAREPRGVLDGSLLPRGAKTGDVLRAEADFELEGIAIVSVAAPRTDKRPEPQRIEVVGPRRGDTPGVTTQLAGRAGPRRPGERRRDRDDRRGHPGERRPDRAAGQPAAPGAPGEPGAEQPSLAGTARRPGGARRTSGADRDRHRLARREAEPRQEGPPHKAEPSRDAPRQAERDRHGRAKRFNPGSAHRKEFLESLPPEQRPVAEQLVRGGIPAVRTALHLEREKALAEGRPAPRADELIAMAEGLLPRLRAAEWRDRAEAAAADLDAVPLRDLRSLVAASDLARDEPTRALAATLREGLEARLAKMRQAWAADIAAHLDNGRVARALRLSSNPPEPASRLEADLASRLAAAAGTAMSASTGPRQWLELLEAAAASPVRSSVVPSGLPAEAPAELKREAHRYSGAIPALAQLLGVSLPPPPPPLAARRRAPGRAS